jgi:Mor family transcriptional regulator
MNARQYSDRNRQMLREREGGSSLEELARKYGLQRATVKALLVSERHRRAFERQPPPALKAG